MHRPTTKILVFQDKVQPLTRIFPTSGCKPYLFLSFLKTDRTDVLDTC